MKPLDEQCTWPELADLIYERCQKEFDKSLDRQKFVDWFMLREKVGLTIDWKLVYKAYQICQELENESDYFVCVQGQEGKGKSTLAFQLASWVNPDLALEDSVYTAGQYISKMQASTKAKLEGEHPGHNQTIIMDEGALDLFSREAMQKGNRNLSKCFFVQRILNFCVIICIPNFYMVDSIIRQHRVRLLISMMRKGKYKAINKRGIAVVNAVMKKVDKDVNRATLPYGSFWEGNNRKPFPKTIDKKEYETTKLNNIAQFLDKANKDLHQEPKLIKLGEVSRALACDRRTILRMAEEGKVKAKKIGRDWYISKESYNILVDVKNEGSGQI